MDGSHKRQQARLTVASWWRGITEVNSNTAGTAYKSHIEKLDHHFKANRNNTLELYKLFNTEWSPDMYFADFETKCREQALHCDFLITLDNATIKLTVVKTDNNELQSEIIRKNGNLKSVRETAKSFEVA